MSDKVGAVMVLGGGIAGLQAALNLAESGVKVYLLEKSSFIGGRLSQLDRWFPTDTCGMCRILPSLGYDEVSGFCLRRGLRHPNIVIMTNTGIESVSGSVAEFTVTIKEKAHYVITDKCIGCELCVEVCPIEVRDEFEMGMSIRKAIYTKHLLAIPHVFTIDIENCNKCGKCTDVCPTQAIDLSNEGKREELDVSSIILAGGFEEFDPVGLTQYGYRRFSDVVTSTELERMLSPTGPGKGKFVRPSDKEVPKRVAFLQCIGSRDIERNYCSAACCMYAMKEATIIKESNPKIDVCIFYMDLRAFGKGYYRYYEKIKRKGVKFVRCRVSAIEEDSKTKNLKISYEAENGKLIKDEFSMVILSVGQIAPEDSKSLGKIFGIKLNKYGFAETENVNTTKEGIYVCGAFSGPKDIEETVTQANSAAIKASRLALSKQVEAEKEGLTPLDSKHLTGLTERSDLAEQEPAIGIFVCGCGNEISNVINIDEIVNFTTKEIPDVVLSEGVGYLCFKESLERVKNTIKEHNLNRVIFASCSHDSFEPLFKKTIKECGLNPSFLEIVDLREQLAWVHSSKEEATRKAKELIAMAGSKIRLQKPLYTRIYPITLRALVVGGGISGLTCALSIAGQGFEVDLVEKTAEPGGNLKNIHYTLEGIDPQRLLKETIEKVNAEKLIHIYKKTEVKKVTGCLGNFRTTLHTQNGKSKMEIEHGVIIVATGAKEYKPKEYLYGKDERIITQKELEERLSNSQFPIPNFQTIVMIQCVGSRNEAHPYCSRNCCSQAIKNALRLKEKDKTTNVYILYRDIMTYGFKEEYYGKAREAGVIFIQYNIDEKPEVKVDHDNLVVKVRDHILNKKLVINPALLVLSTGIIPNDNESLAKTLNLPLTDDGFFREVDARFRPMDCIRDGIFICGLAHSPRSIKESIIQADAAAARAVSLLSRKELRTRRILPVVNERLCSGCRLCIQICPFDARKMDEETNTSKVIDILCQGCGACAVTCPNGATRQKGFERKQELSVVDAMVGF